MVLTRDDWDDEQPELSFFIQMASWQPWYKRFWSAVRYVFGKNPSYGHWDSTLVRLEDARQFRDIFDAFIRDSEVYWAGKQRNGSGSQEPPAV